MTELLEKARKPVIYGLAAGVVLIDSVSYFWSMAGDLFLISALLFAMRK